MSSEQVITTDEAPNNQVAADLPKYPKGVFIMFTLQLLGMVGFIMVTSLLVLYCTRQLGMSNTKAYTLLAAYNSLVFSTSVFGGYLGERYLGYRHGTSVSIALSIIGLLIITIHSTFALYWGLGFFVIATGMMVPCTFVLLGRLYNEDNDPRRDSGFTIAYIGMNVGGFVASFFAGYISKDWGFSTAFAIGAIVTVGDLILFLAFRKRFRRQRSVAETALERRRMRKNRKQKATGWFLLILSIPLTAALLNFASLSNILMLLLGAFSVVIVLVIASRETRKYKKRLVAFLILTIVSVAFWALYSIAPSALTIFIADNVNRHIGDMVVPTATYYSLNPFFIITLGPLMTWFWMKRNAKKAQQISIPAKFALGILLMGLGYLVLVLPIDVFPTANGVINSWWIVFSYFLQTAGELFVGPIGFAMVGELVPARLEGLMMGIWQLATGVAGALSAYMADMTTTPKLDTTAASATDPAYAHAFLLFGAATVGVAIITALLTPYIKRIISSSDKRVVAGH